MSIIPRMNKKGVSPIIATLLLIVIAVAAAVVTYAFVTGFIGTAGGQAQTSGQMSVDSVSASASGGTVTVWLRNSGTKVLDMNTATAAMYVNNVKCTFAGATAFPVGSVQQYNVTGVTGLTAGVSGQLRIVATDGTPVQVSFLPVA